MTTHDDDLDGAWDKIGGPAPEPEASGDDGETKANSPEAQLGPPIRATFVIRADKVPVAPWAQGWRVGSLGPHEGHVTLVCEHDIEVSPVAQLSAITGILGTIKHAQLDVVWWAIQTRGPLEPGEDDMDAALEQLLGPQGASGDDED